jgi:hypothetical protein
MRGSNIETVSHCDQNAMTAEDRQTDIIAYCSRHKEMNSATIVSGGANIAVSDHSHLDNTDHYTGHWSHTKRSRLRGDKSFVLSSG